MADLNVTVTKSVEAGAVAGSSGLIAFNVGSAIDTYVQARGVNVPSGSGFVLITTVIPAIYKGFSNWLKHRGTK